MMIVCSITRMCSLNGGVGGGGERERERERERETEEGRGREGGRDGGRI
jgi:hypothetical protein